MIVLANAEATDRFGRRVAQALWRYDRGLVVTLDGELGAGKTALARAAITTFDPNATVVSPSYTLVEPYAVAGRTLYHLDLYRLADPEELEFLGLRDMQADRDWLFVEWAIRGQGYLPSADIALGIAYAGRDATSGRTIDLQAHSAAGRQFLGILENTH